MVKKMTASELLVGRRLPSLPAYRDILLGGFVKGDGTFCGKFEPTDSWLRPAFKRIRQKGLVRAGFALSISVGRSTGRPHHIFYLTEKGEAEARLSAEKVKRINEDRRQWSLDFREAHRTRQVAISDLHMAETSSETEHDPSP